MESSGSPRSSVPQTGLDRLIEKGPILRFGPDRPRLGSDLIIRPMALVRLHPPVTLGNLRIQAAEILVACPVL